ncbi:MAG: septation ring formation regulator EzrA [Bacilli bacterium]|nr:septation ring formation regulator EzrA [Bacilli bacterium]
MDDLILLMISICIVAVFAIVIVLNLIQNYKVKKIKKLLNKLEIEKNVIDCAPITPELAKIESFLKNEKLEVMYNDWQERLKNIKNYQVPRLNDLIIEAEYSLNQSDYKSIIYKIARLEMETYKVKTNSDILLDEIKTITTSEERNRAIVTNLKAKYRDLYQKFSSCKLEFGEIGNSVNLQFENIAKRFEQFEIYMENNEYTEVTQIIKSIDEMLKHMEIVIEEVPAIVLTAKTILPKKISEIEDEYKKLINIGYPLDYLNVEYNITEANNKINDIMTRLRVLNLEDSLFELKVLLDYFDSLFNDFEKEKINRNNYEEISLTFKERLDKTNNLVEEIFTQIDDIKNIYDLSKDDLDLLNEVRKELKSLNNDYKALVDHTGNNTFAYSKLVKEIESLVLRLSSIEDRLDNSLDAIGSMKEDEVRARQQLEEVKIILKDAKTKMRDYNLPLIPKNYYIELNEASAAIKEIVRELDKKPIAISTLNTRVDTARDLVFKIYGTTKEMLKTAMFAEMAIVYGNRYRTNVNDLDKNLTYSEILFYKGEYQKSLELTINILNKIEPGIYNKLLKLYGEESK